MDDDFRWFDIDDHTERCYSGAGHFIKRDFYKRYLQAMGRWNKHLSKSRSATDPSQTNGCKRCSRYGV
jgi:hypothetical protein